MDSILTEFIERTEADPALARDLLEATEWNLDMAVMAYESLHDTKSVEPQEYVYNPKDFESISTLTEEVIPEEEEMADGTAKANMEENEARRREMVRRKKHKRSRGLSFPDADEVIDKFNKVAVVKQRVSTQEQIIIDEKFFHHSFVYPDFSAEVEELQQYIASDLLETSHKKALEKSGRLNWWTTAGRLPRLDPMATSGDGNCLLHAASLYMWGLHDHSLILRTALHRLLTTGLEKEGVKRRWKYQTQLRNDEAGGLTFTEEEWEEEWGEILRIATNKPRREPTTGSLRRHGSLRTSYESLEEIHISALAHTLRRPVIIISDRTIKDLRGEDLAPIYFGGIYLPLEVNPTACHKSPVVLAYDSSHFSPLVAFQASSEQSTNQKPRSKYARLSSRVETVIPLVTPDGSLLPVQFIHDPKKRDTDALKKWSTMQYTVGEFPDDIVRLLESYLNVRWIQLKMSSADNTTATAASSTEDYDHLFPVQVPKVRFPAACIMQEAQPIYQKELVERYLKHVREKYEEEKTVKAQRQAEWEESERQRLLNVIVPCEGEGCEMFGRPATNNMCSVCYCKMMRAAEEGVGKDGAAVESSPDVEDHRMVELPPPYACESHDLRPSSEELTAGPTGQPNDLPTHQAAPGHPDKTTPHHSPPPKVKQPLAALQLNGQDSKARTSLPRPTADHTPDEITPRSRSPSPKPHPRSKSPSPRPSAVVPKKAAMPSKGVLPSSVQNPKSSPRWLPNMFKKAPSTQSGGSRYSRDNIQPIHLDSDDTQGLNKAGIATSEKECVSVIGMKKKCLTASCDLYGSPNCAGYCSGCYEIHSVI